MTNSKHNRIGYNMKGLRAIHLGFIPQSHMYQETFFGDLIWEMNIAEKTGKSTCGRKAVNVFA